MFYPILKRAFDICCAALGLLLASPFFLLIAIGVKLSSQGPVFYRADRIGRNDQPFTLYKFRSMHVFQPSGQNPGKKTEGGFIANAQRIFPFGAFLRKSKLDELPQLINILLGQMSFVGPRPITQAGVAKHYVGRYSKITQVTPGLACLDSLYDYAHGELFVSSNEEYKEKVLPVRLELARIYTERRSVLLDLRCIFRTVYLIFAIGIFGKRHIPLDRYEEEATALVEEGKLCRASEEGNA